MTRVKKSGILISIIIPSYNRENELKQLVRSILIQNPAKYGVEILVVDDGSDDNTYALIKNCKKQGIKYIKQQNLGPAAARNNGYLNAKGKFLAFLDSDVIVDKNYVRNSVDFIDTHPDADCVEGATLSTVTATRPTYFTNSVENLRGGQYMTCNIIYSRRIMDITGGFDTRYNNPYIREDTDMAFAAMKAGGKFYFNGNMRVTHPFYAGSYRDIFKLARQGIHEPLLFMKFPCLYFKKLKWLDGWFVPVYYLGYYAMPLLVILYFFTKDIFWVKSGILVFLFSYVVTIYVQFRKRKFRFTDFLTVSALFIFVPYLRLFWIAAGFIKHGSEMFSKSKK